MGQLLGYNMSKKCKSVGVIAFASVSMTFSAYAADYETLGSDTTPQTDQRLTACPEYVQPEIFPHQSNFLSNVVKLRPVTLIGDTDHQYPNLLSYLSNEETIAGWSRNGVTDVHIEVNPAMEQIISQHIHPVFNKEGIRGAFEKYLNDRGLYALDEWVQLRAKYFTDLVTLGYQYGIDIHFISNDPEIALNNPEMWNVYAQYTQAKVADCPGETDNLRATMQSPEFGDIQDFVTFAKELLQQRIDDTDRIRQIEEKQSGGRQVVIFGDSHFCKGNKNIKALLGQENTTHVSIFFDELDHDQRSCKRSETQQPDFSYYLKTDRAEGIKGFVTADQVERGAVPPVNSITRQPSNL